MSDTIDFAAQLAFKLYEEGKISEDVLTTMLKTCINARARENGYVDKYGLPCGEDDEDLESK